MAEDQHHIAEDQRQRFEHLSAQLAEILGVLRGPAAADPAPESERSATGPLPAVARHVA
ncbi:MAG: hypothetical protein JO309_08150 [Pseudonocardiales bacterium]|nr:hypothetical protein [Pseudonocardiales bacterium]MBV9729359.1 hypothetical protein [Pseudonocardiales bacterium]